MNAPELSPQRIPAPAAANHRKFADLGILPSVSLVQRPAGSPCRFPVPDRLVPWEREFPGYSPPHAGDPTVPAHLVERHRHVAMESFEGRIETDRSGLPLNVMGRTGLTGRGRLWKFGPNHAADAVVVRPGDQPGQVEALLIRRPDGSWAFPGGFVDPGEDLKPASLRELYEEAAVTDASTRELLETRARCIYQGYADDPRNTDNAWIETSAFLIPLSREESSRLAVRAGDDAQAAAWSPLTSATIRQLYGGHPQLATIVLAEVEFDFGGAGMTNRFRSKRIETLDQLPSDIERIGLFGGSFDPIHQGHLDAAEAALRAHLLDAVVFLPAVRNPFKGSPLFGAEERIRRIEDFIRPWPSFFVSASELQHGATEDASYTVDSLLRAKSELAPHQSLHFLLGADTLPSLHLWKNWQHCLELAEFIPVRRGTVQRRDLHTLESTLGADVVAGLYRRFVDVSTAQISSAEIREQLRGGGEAFAG